MHEVIIYIRRYFSGVSKLLLSAVTLFTALLVFVNYYWGLDPFIRTDHSTLFKLIAWTLVFLAAFGFPYLLSGLFTRGTIKISTEFLFLLCIAPVLFALKMCVRINFTITDDPGLNHYWNQVLYWPVLAAGMTIMLFIIWKIMDRENVFFGLKARGVNWKPYLIMLGCMVPLVAIASTQHDFLQTYPKMRLIDAPLPPGGITGWQKILFELGYGSDFFTIEIFFRGFLVLGFLKWAGKDAILPMACFYCTIHFGKPLGECISSYFGGILLGIVAMETRSVLGGLLVHLGIAWMMEVGGYLGNMLGG